MLKRLIAVFRRFASRHAAAEFPGFAILDEAGGVLGYVDRLRIVGDRVAIDGWTFGSRVGVSLAGQSYSQRPDLARSDVTMAHGGRQAGSTPGFALEIPFPQEAAWLWVVRGGLRHLHPLELARGDLARARRATLPAFLRACARALRPALRWRLSGDPAARARLKEVFGLATESGVADLPPDLFIPEGAPPTGRGPRRARVPVTVVMPIYNAFDLLPEALDRLVCHTDLPWHLVAVEDCSSDPRVRPWLRKWRDGLSTADQARVTLLENATNQGFIGAVNRAFEVAVARGDHVVLLNSDALVPAAWASRLLSPILSDPGVASVTPMSNDAEIFTVPTICARADLGPGEGDEIDAVARRIGPSRAVAEAPTGVGFCMAMNIDYLRANPRLDPAFGRGYGEEVDWCQKARRAGGRHVSSATLFVEHRGGASFGSAEKQKLVRANNAMISDRYPAYDAEVQAFIASDPLCGPRLALGLAWVATRQKEPLPIYLAHALGGGAEHYLQGRIAGDLARCGAALVLRVGGTRRWQLELHTPNGRTCAATDDWAQVVQLCQLPRTRRIIYSCGVGERDPVSLPARLLELVSTGQDMVEVLFHDYFPASPSYTLLDADGSYTGMPAPDRSDAAHSTVDAQGEPVALADWRAAWARLIGAADEIVTFSPNSRTLVGEAFPEAGPRIRCRPHSLHSAVGKVVAAPALPAHPVIGVLGNIGVQKGAAVVSELSQALARTSVARIVVLGNLDPAFPLAAKAGTVHGDYRVEDLPALVRHYGITCWLQPSIWPETFSYTTHEALATGLPVWAFDIGAQGDAVSSAARRFGRGGVLSMQALRENPEQLLSIVLGQDRKASA